MKIVFGSTLSHFCFKLSSCWFCFSKIYFRSHFFALTSKSFSKRVGFNNIQTQKRLVKILIKKNAICCEKFIYIGETFSRICAYIIGRKQKNQYDQKAVLIPFLSLKNRSISFMVCLLHTLQFCEMIYSEIGKEEK